MVKSWLFLALNFVITIFKKLSGMRRGAESFIKNYESEGLYPVSPDLKEVILSAERCISCGYCEVKGEKGISIIPHLARDISMLKDLRMEITPVECPFGVSFDKIAALTHNES